MRESEDYISQADPVRDEIWKHDGGSLNKCFCSTVSYDFRGKILLVSILESFRNGQT